ncbi:hypothetical protein DL98DRAFT_519847 [Cadophora sp. DSE1049]|nr:hypothetical protein DL98DRAFT_519847 [Cadophora sp. DSE1049]
MRVDPQYMDLIDTFEEFAASALIAATLKRYVAAGGMTGLDTYCMCENLGVHWTLTVLGCISLLLTPAPYV